ncbi:MAG: acyl-CoA thioesterase [Candidatus Binatia bacterium]
MIKHVERMRVNWVDTDASGLIHYTAALRYFETAEHALMRKLFPGPLPPADTCLLPRVHVEADYNAGLRYPDEFDCTARVLALGNSSVTYGYEIHRPDGLLCIRGQIVAAACDFEGRSIPLPSPLRAGLARAL